MQRTEPFERALGEATGALSSADLRQLAMRFIGELDAVLEAIVQDVRALQAAEREDRAQLAQLQRLLRRGDAD